MMRWPGRRTAAGAPGGELEPLAPAPLAHHSPGLHAVLTRARGRQPCRVLDLGAAVGSNIALFATFSNHVRVVDLLALDGPGRRLAELEADRLRGATETALPSEWGRFDLVLAWDLLIHIGELPARSVVERIGALSEPGACLYALVATTDDMPERPLEYRILDDETLEYRSAASGRRPNPRWPPSLVERLLRGWLIDCSFVLRHGVQEYVAIRQ